MALQIEIWVKSIIEGLFANSTFAARSVDHSEFVNGKKVHVPNAGEGPGVVKNRADFPASASQRQDADLDYDIDEYSVDPVRISNAEQVELSYNKRESVVRSARRKLADVIYTDLIYKWIPQGVTVIKTVGAAVAATLESATGNRKSMTKATVHAARLQFDKSDIPQEGRCMLLDPEMYTQLLNDLTDAERNNFLSCADPSMGIIGKYDTFMFYERSKVAKATSAGAVKEWSAAAAATDCAAGLAWQEDCVSRALGETVAFDSQGNPMYYGDILSFLQRAGGSNIRSDKKGVILIVQDTAA